MQLITSRTLLCIKKSIISGERVYAHPFIWNNLKNCPELSSCRKSLFGWYCGATVTLLHWCFILCRCAQVNTSESVGVIQRVFILSVTILMSIPVALQVTFALNLERFPTFVRQYTEMAQDIYKLDEIHETTVGSGMSRFCELAVVGCYVTFWFELFLWVSGAVCYPDSPHLLSSVDPFRSSVMGVLISTLLWAYFLVIFVVNSNLMIGIFSHG